MDRRRFLAVTAAALVAGCNSTGGDPATETDSPTQSPSPTTDQTEQPAEPTTETETRTETETETETPDAEERAETALADARRAVGRAYAAYVDQAEDAGTLVDVGPATTGFDAEPVADEIGTAIEHLDTASEAATDEQAGQIDALRESATWLRATARFQAATGSVVEHLESVAERAEDVDDLGAVDVYDDLVADLEAAEAGISDVSQTESDVDEPNLDAFEPVEGVDTTAIDEKDDDLLNISLAFGAMRDPLVSVRRETRRIETAREELADDADDAEGSAERAARRLRRAFRSVADRNNPASFAAVVEVFDRTVEALVDLAEQTVADAEDA